MKRITRCVCGLVVLSMVLAGCDTLMFWKDKDADAMSAKTAPPTPEEFAAMQGLEVARANYEVRLEALQAHVTRSGDMQKRIWAERELKNLSEAHGDDWKGPGLASKPKVAAFAKANEAMLVELVVTARGQYVKAVDDLLAVYQGRQDLEKAEVIQEMVDQFNPVKTYLYYLAAEVPSQSLRGTERVLAADRAFEAGMTAYEAGKSLLTTPGSSHKKRMEALQAFQLVVYNHPTSSKIGAAAYYIAEINRKYSERTRTAAWYNRALTWDARLREPIRYRMATLYDYEIKDYEKALKYYRLAVRHEKDNRQNMEHARKRIQALKGRFE